MRHKQRPTKSSRHNKSVTCIIKSHTSFGDRQQQQQQHQHQQHEQHEQHEQQLQLQQNKKQQPAGGGGGGTRYIIAANEYRQQNNSLIRNKQFEHNYGHMSDVMRLAFLENNDIQIDDPSSTTIDFNHQSTVSILQRNIQQQLQQEHIKEQLRLKQQQQQQELLIQEQLHNHNHHHQHQRTNQYHHNHHHHPKQQSNNINLHRNQQNLNHQNNDNNTNHQHHHNRHHNRQQATTATVSISQRNLQQQLLQGARGGEEEEELVDDDDIDVDHLVRQRLLIQEQLHNQRPNQHQYQKQQNININTNNINKNKNNQQHHQERQQPNQQVQIVASASGAFFCDEPGCGKQFPSYRKLRHHLVVHSEEFPYVCAFKGCNKKFKRKFGIDLHSTTHFDLDPAMFNKTSNNSSLPFFGRRMQYSMCKPCGQKFKTVHEYQHHMLEHGKEPFKCPVKGCGQTFGIWKSFQKHRASHYFNYYCRMDPKCDHHTSNLQLLKLHIYCCHFKRKLPDNATLLNEDVVADDQYVDDSIAGLDDNEDLPEQIEPMDEEESIEERPIEEIPIPKPVQTTPRRGNSNHQSSVSISQRNIQQLLKQDDDSYDEQDLIIEEQFPQEQQNHCPKQEDSPHEERQQMHQERQQMHQERQQQQQKMMHNGAFFCDEPGCGKQFPSYRKLRHHLVVHSEEFPYICAFKGCNKKFKRKFGIDLHSTTHFDLDPDMFNKTSNNSSLPFFGRRMQYSMCKPCGQKFKTVHEYQNHMLEHGKEPFKCPVKGCGQTFGIWKSFQKHRASHYFNYYCRMDPKCDHHTSNLQLLKLHIYCCHFKRKLPDNATLLKKDTSSAAIDDTDDLPDQIEPMDEEEDEEVKVEEGEEEEESQEESQPEPELAQTTPRRDPRLRQRPPRSSSFGQQDYATINNGGALSKSAQSSPQKMKRTRSTVSSSGGSQSLEPNLMPSPEKKVKLPLKVLPKRSAQRLPMCMLADDASTEDELQYSSSNESHQNDRGDEDDDNKYDSNARNKFKCHLCDYKFSVRFQLTKHLSTHLELTPEMYSKTADKKVVKLSERRRREFFCEKCNIKFEQMKDLDDHMLRKHGQRPYTCNFCQVPSTFRIARQYLNHLYEHRFNYKCTMAPDCDFTINRKDALKLHIFRMHLNQQLPEYLENFAKLVATAVDV